MRCFYLLIIIFSYVNLFSQDIQNIDFTFKNNTFYISYDLSNCGSNQMYDVKLTLEGRKSGYYTPVNISGDLFNQTCGSNKKITWSPLAEGKQLKEEVRFFVEISAKKKLIENGPSNAYRSMILPGLGSLKVQKTKLPLLVTAGFLFSGIQAFRYNSMTNSNFNNYLNANNQSDLNSYYQSAKEARNTTYMYTGIAAGIWVSDVIYTLIKGSVNKRTKNLSNLNSKNWKINFYASQSGLNFGLKKEL